MSGRLIVWAGDDVTRLLLERSASDRFDVSVVHDVDQIAGPATVLCSAVDAPRIAPAVGADCIVVGRLDRVRPPVTPQAWEQPADPLVVTTAVTERDRASLPVLLAALRVALDERPALVLRLVTATRVVGAARRAADNHGLHGHVDVVDLDAAGPARLASGSAALIHTTDTVIATHHAAWADDAGIPWCRLGPAAHNIENDPRVFDQESVTAWLLRPATDVSRPVGSENWSDIIEQMTAIPAGTSTRTRRWAGVEHEVRDDLLEPACIERAVAIASSALTSAGVSHVLVTAPGEPGRLAVRAADADNVVQALIGLRSPSPLMVDALDARGHVLSSDNAQNVRLLPGVVGFRVHTPVLTSGATLRYGPDLGCMIELWQPEPTRTGFASPTTPTRRGPILTHLDPDTTTPIAETAVPTRKFHLAPSVDDVTFPIDAVWTWVDGSDPAWRQQRDRWSGRTSASSDGDLEGRYESQDELRYSLRSSAMYAPWIRHRYLLTAGQRPDWLADVDDVIVIDHADVIPPEHLPTFNSHAIENHLHLIPDLSEQFLYFNDDVFLGRRCRPEQFFTPAGQPRAFPSPTGVPEGPVGADDFGYYAARKNNRDLVQQQFGVIVPHGYRHTPHALRRSLLERIQQMFPEAWEATSASRFRSDDDIAVVSALHHDVGRILGDVVEGSVRTKHIPLGTTEAFDALRDLAARRHLDVFCLNAGLHVEEDPERTAHALAAFMAAYFPVAAPWESV